MEDNQLGRNIKHLREAYAETLEELGNVVHCAKSTVKGYENGSRKPDLQTLKTIALHYNKTVDELLNTDLTGLGEVTLDFNSASTLVDLMKVIVPLYCSEDALKNDNFKKGYELSQRLLDGFSKAETLPGSMIERIFKSFLSAADESEAPEAVANIMWCIFVWWTQIYDTRQLLSLKNEQLSKKLSLKDYMKLRDMESDETKEKRKSFIVDFESVISSALRNLKSEMEWSDLADYYLALRYIVGMVDTDLTSEMDLAVGMQMMLSFITMGNDLAFRFCDICMSV
ncbi:MAG: helix-turn-helix transcriptional regulator [Lachnospiraceae bacterium]|nr:helix-turn-helix transcriptional regulator [Lachnospiraceae bacterium]